jgi:uncharacterized protein YsxB (DUF464 family)
MTKIHFRQNGNHFTATFTGHANAKRHDGNDLVCAAISMLSQTLMQYACDALERGHLVKIGTIRQNPMDGAVSVDVLANNDGFPHVLGAFSAVATGCALLAEKHPDNVSLGREFQAYNV